MTNQPTHYVITTPQNAGNWLVWGRIAFRGNEGQCTENLAEWDKADEEARSIGNNAASCDTRFAISVSEYDQEHEKFAA